jgi:uncharacterized protein (DUF58 family)
MSVKALLSPSILAEIKRLHFHTRMLADQGLVGQYRSAFRGQGIEFEEVREYVPGDDIRAIDWKVTARSQRPFIKSFREERELTVLIAVDTSASTLTGTKVCLREQLIARVGAIIALVALRNNDRVGLLAFSDEIESFHPPRKGRSAVWRILHEVLAPQTVHRQTDFKEAAQFLNRVLKRRSIVFLVSDFHGLSAADIQPLSVLARRHDLTAVRVLDSTDYELPNAGLISIADVESGESALIDSSDQVVRARFQDMTAAARQNVMSLLSRAGCGVLDIRSNEDLVSRLRSYLLRKGDQHGTRRARLVNAG